MIDSRAEKVVDRFRELEAERRTYESFWQDIRDLVRPNTTDFQATRQPGDMRTEKIYDGTAPQALEELASGLQSFLTSPSDRWFELRVDRMDQIADDRDAVIWLQEVSDLLFEEFSRSDTNLNPSLQENYTDLGAFGTSILFSDKAPGGQLSYRAIPLADCYIADNHLGRVDTLYRRLKMTTRQLFQQFGSAVPPHMVDDKKDQKYEVIHAVSPRTDRDTVNPSSTNMRFGSVWVLKGADFSEAAVVLKESGFKSFPYHVPRWTKLPMEPYGRGPALKCLPDIKMLNRMEFTNIKAAQKLTDPPLLVPDDGFILPIKTSPGSINFKEPNEFTIETLPVPTQLPTAIEYTNQKRDFIRQCFFADWLRMEKEKIEMTAFEVQDRRDEKLRFLAPMLGRIEAELLSPLIERAYDLKREANALPEPPASLRGRTLRVGYISPASAAQRGMRAVQMGRYIQELAPVAQIDDTVFDAVDLDVYAQELALARLTPMKIIRGAQQIAAIRAQRAEQEQLAAVAGAAEPVSKAVKNLSEANAAGNIL